MSIRSGKFRHKLVFNSLGGTKNTFGEFPDTPVPFATVRGSIRPLWGTELFTAKQVLPEVTHEVRIRYRSGIVASMQFVHRSRTFEVLEVHDADLELQHEMLLMCKEQINS